MKKYTTYASLLFNLLFASTGYAVSDIQPSDYCQSILDRRAAQAEMREEIRAANHADRASGREAAIFSNFIDGRAKDIDASALSGSHVVSLGSGPDIFLPVYMYPLAKYFHLVDALAWGKEGPAGVVIEIEERIQALAPGAVVDRLDDLGDWQKIEGTMSGPLIWRVRWQSARLGPQEKVIFLHVRDFEDPASQQEVKEHIFNGPYRATLGGVVVTGIAATLETRRFYLSLLQAGGSMFTEILYTRPDGETSTPQDKEILEALEKEADIERLGSLYYADPEKEPDLYARLYHPQQFLIRPRR